MKKKLLAVILTACIAGALSACGDSPGSSSDGASDVSEMSSSEKTESDALSSDEIDSGDKEALREKLDEKIDDKISFDDMVRSDTTGRWRLALVATSKPVTKWAVDYYKAYFESDDEIHYVVNFTLGTTSNITVIDDNTLEVDSYEYVESEEQDAKTLGSGMMLGQYWVYIDSGEVERLD